MASILFYGPFNQRSRDTESLMIAFRKQGHEVLLLSQQEGNQINDFLRPKGIQTYTHVLSGTRSGWWYYFRHLMYFISFCWKKKVDIVYSHLEPANFVASVGQYFIRAKTYLCRHHIDEGQLYKFDKDLYYRLTYWLARRIIVVSSHARNYMITHEHMSAKKIIHIDLAYDFDFYEAPKTQNVDNIRKANHAAILLVGACRLTKFKRPELTIEIVKKLRDQGLDVKLVLLGRGEMLEQLKLLIKTLGLENNVTLPGYVTNVLEYIDAADFFIHPSVLDSSCVVIKEAGLVKTPVIVCENVGDFNDYIVHGKNGFSINATDYVKEAAAIITEHFSDTSFLHKMGAALYEEVEARFSIKTVIHKYNDLNVLE